MAASWVWNPKPQPDDDSWEVKAFAEDTGHVTWPPRSYTCTFCTREFQSAQALGGHMNVHRRDRARLHQSHPATTSVPLINQTSSPCTREFAPILPYHFNSLMVPQELNNSPSSLHYSFTGAEPADNNINDGNNNISKQAATEELDLELRLGHRPTPS
ncbi:hypothetical protein F3Y22_tig00111848pilonHSYRG00062 [Hibiscus syriacus]|uniref:C2H2-type domain-containing protein n=2 Tax=Hibiscus syriacus TaxID=106335 RepID=A0A6A2X9Q0_HIBSY|nr:hypothetical protein F3Y22_tig00111848pilonHSYRG00062 [Hibiscus syriacus]